ncbi:hypothetical protein ADL22_12340 [Streptomyces sp. NRRL F-4489]|uniref:hypothetical protein n=1 Tax=Streptomyces sp. NRRL F-4489 TaxID=1609095 RepID=UPI000748F51D|nr:hypothetical protein [Streptomyces sp. NRRL F-4489]KUL44726.1 hypothetical protein ADL22_12340 [Streptomyces sp. NRRL F-4489]
MTQRTVAIAGTGAISKAAVYDLLTDWLGYEESGEKFVPTQRARDTHFVFPAHPDLISRTLQHVYNWTGRANIDYTTIYAENHTDDRGVKLIVENAEQAQASQGIEEIYAEMLAYLREQEGDRTLLILTDTNGGEGTNAGCDELITAASTAGIETLDLGCALMPYPVQAAAERMIASQEDDAPAEEGKDLMPTTRKSAGEAAPDIDADIAEAHRSQAPHAAGDPATGELIPLLRRLTEVVESVLITVDSTLSADLTAERDALYEIKVALRSAEPDADAAADPKASPAEAPGAEPDVEVRRGWYNEELEEYLPLKGRPRKGVEIHDIVMDHAKGKWVKYQPNRG